MIYIITDNQFLYSGINLLLRKHNLTTSQISVHDIRKHKIREGDVFFIECPLSEDNIQSLGSIYTFGARVCFLLRRSIEGAGSGDLKFIDATTRMTAFAQTVLKKIAPPDQLPPPAQDSDSFRLTNREYAVARLVLCGHSDEDIASILYISKRSSQDYINRVLKKLGGKSVADIYLQRNVIYSCSVSAP